jgi:hypothetical protein
MSISIVKKPITLINGHKSKWLPAHQPITFEIQRRDATIMQFTGIKENGVITKLRITINWDLNVIQAKAGQRVVIFKPVPVTLTIASIISSNVLDVYITSTNQIPTIYTLINFPDVNHYIETKVSYVNGSVYNEIGSVKSKTDTNGIAKVSVQELLATKCINQNNFLYNALNLQQGGEGSRFNIQIRDFYNQKNIHPYTVLSNTNVMYYTNSANQIQDKYSYNMGSFVPTLDDTRTDKAKFQSVFKRPTYFVGYPFSLNFIYSDNMLNYQLVKKEQPKDINGNIVMTTTDNLNVASRDWANRLMLNQNYTSNIKTIDIWLETNGITTQNPYVDSGYVSGFYKPYQPNNVYVEGGYQRV